MFFHDFTHTLGDFELFENSIACWDSASKWGDSLCALPQVIHGFMQGEVINWGLQVSLVRKSILTILILYAFIMRDHGGTWHVSGVSCNSLKAGSPSEIRRKLYEELVQWNPVLCTGVKRVCPMCQPDDVYAKETVSILITFTTSEAYEQVVQDGVAACGVHCRVSWYTPQRQNLQQDSVAESGC